MSGGSGVRRPRPWIAAALAAVLAAGAAWAQPQLTVELDTDRRGRPLLVATATDETGAPVTNHEVAFFLLPDFFPNEGERINGMHPVPLGTDTTNAVGKADEVLEPPYSGSADVEVRLLDDGGDTLAVGSTVVEMVRETSPRPAAIEPPLAGVRRPIEIAILGAVALVWTLLIVVLVATVVSIRRHGREPAAQP